MTLANRITCVRLLLVPVFCVLVLLHSHIYPWARYAALAVYAVAALTDALDGMVARRFNQQTPLGKRLDPLADKLLINLGFVFLAASPSFTPGVPMWFPVVLVARDTIVVVGAMLLNAFVGRVTINVRAIGKLTAIFQNCTMLGALLGVSFLPWLIAATALLTAASCIEYVYDGITQYRAMGGSSNGHT